MILNDLIEYKYNVVNLTNFDLEKIELFVKEHKKQIPNYTSLK